MRTALPFPQALAATALLLMACAAHAGPGAHQHGVAQMSVAVDGKVLEISLQSPLDNLLAFERAPRTEAERQAVRQMAQRFHAAAALYTPTPAAQCKPSGAELTSDVLDAALLAAPGAAAAAAAAPSTTSTPKKKPGDEHADLEATVRFECANPSALKGLEVGLFKAFPKFRQIDAAVASGSGQRGTKLNARQASLAW